MSPRLALTICLLVVPSAMADDAPVAAFREWLALDPAKRPSVADQSFANTPLNRGAADAIRDAIWADFAARVKLQRADEWRDRKVALGGATMRFDVKKFGDKPTSGHSLFISLHGGGNAAIRVNDRQWENQKRLYRPEEGVYISPRAPGDTWDLWHKPPVDVLIERVIADAILLESVDPDRVYLTGYSAGGDGVFRLAPRMADRWAAAAMMAGHPGDVSPLSLRNLPFAIHVGALDTAYDRHLRAKEWGMKLDELRTNDPKGYEHETALHAGKPHWMGGADAVAIGWMAKHRRTTVPSKVVWQPDSVPRASFYWLALPPEGRTKKARVEAIITGNVIRIQAANVRSVAVRLIDGMVDLDAAVTIEINGLTAFTDRVPRTVATLLKTLDREDPKLMFPAEISVTVPP